MPAKDLETTSSSSQTRPRWAWLVLSPHEIRHIGIEIIIVAVGVFLALLVDQFRQDVQQRQLVTQARAAIHEEAQINLSRIARKLALMHRDASTVAARPELAPQLVEERANEDRPPFEAAWITATQTGGLRFIRADQVARISTAYTSEALYGGRDAPGDGCLDAARASWRATGAATRDSLLAPVRSAPGSDCVHTHRSHRASSRRRYASPRCGGSVSRISTGNGSRAHLQKAQRAYAVAEDNVKQERAS